MSDTRPVGVFDSGVGGLSVLCRLNRMLPEEDFIYFGDRKNAPYGDKTHDEVRRITEENVDLLLSMNAKALVIACNTATAAAIVPLREKYPAIPIIGIEPAVKPAADAGSRCVLVLATPRTVREPRFHELIRAHGGSAEVIAVPCEGLADMVERGKAEGREANEYFSRLFARYSDKKFDAVVLGCTHYPFARRAIEKAVGENVRIYDGSIGTARQTARLLERAGLTAPEGRLGKITMISSDGDNDSLQRLYDGYCISVAD